jgi:hypothetical protein
MENKGDRQGDSRRGFVVMTAAGERWFVATMSTQPDGSIYGYLVDGGRCVSGTVSGDGTLSGDRFEPDGLYPAA